VQDLQGVSRDLSYKTQAQISLQRQRHARAEQALAHLNPQRVIELGFALLQAQDGAVIKSCADVASGQILSARLADGTIDLMAQ